MEGSRVVVDVDLKLISADILIRPLSLYAHVKEAWVDQSLPSHDFPFESGMIDDNPFVTLRHNWELRWILFDDLDEPEESDG